MTSRNVTTEQEREMLVRYIQEHKLPFHATVADGRKRSLEQNKLQRQWMTEIAEQLEGENAEYWRGYCKAYFGIPILCRDDPEFREAYERDIKPLSYEIKLSMMQEPHDYSVTRKMTVKQKSEYLDEIQRHFAEQGVILTQPESPPVSSSGRPPAPLLQTEAGASGGGGPSPSPDGYQEKTNV